MQLVYGTVQFQPSSMEVTSSTEARMNAAGIPVSHVSTVNCQGVIFGDGSQNLTLLSRAVDIGLAQAGASLVLYDDQGIPTETTMPAAGSVGGVIPLRWEFPSGGAGEYVTGRIFRATFQAEYPLSLQPGTLLDFRETVQIFGNTGPRINYQEAVNGPQIAVQSTPFTLCRAVQSGTALGYLDYPRVPPPLWPTWLQNESPGGTLSSPRPRGRLLTEWPVTWSYQFLAPVKLSGTPTVWRG